MRLLFLFVFMLGYILPATGQVYDVRKFSVNEGLPSGQVTDIVQDHKGIAWVATYGGLVQFNGLEFKTYTEEDGLNHNFVYELFIDSKHNFWVATEGMGIGLFDGKSMHYPEEVNEVLGEAYIMNIEESPDGRLWFATYGSGLYVKDGESFRHYNTENGLASDIVWHSYFDEVGNAWISTENGLSVIEGESVKTYTESDGLSSNIVYRVTSDSEGTLWAGTFYGVTKYEDGVFSTPESLHGDKIGTVYDIVADDVDRIWAGTALYGVRLFDNDKAVSITKRHGLTSNYIFRLFKDRDGDVWVGTDEDGINIIRHLSFKFFGLESGFNFGAVLSLREAKDKTLYIGTDTGLAIHRNGLFGYDGKPKTVFRGRQIWNLEELTNGNLLVQVGDNSIIEYDGTKETDFLKKIGIESDEEYLNELFIDSKQRIWIGTQNGLWLYENGKLNSFTVEDGLSNNFIWVVREDSKGRIWIGTDDGINYYENGEIVNITTQLELASDVIGDIVEDKDGDIWVGTSKGLCLLMEKDGKWTHELFELNEVYLRDTQSLIIDNEGFLWHGTNGGLHCYNINMYKDTGKMMTSYFPLEEYGNGIEFMHKAVIKSQNGKVLFGTADEGILEYTKMTKGGMRISRPPTIVEATSNFIPFDYEGEELPELTYSDNNIEITFSGLSYSDPNRIFYKFKLQGFDKDWRYNYDEDHVHYTSLPAGRYTFEVYTRTGQTDWSTEPASFEFKIQRPYWLSLWFYAALLAVFIGLVYAYVRYRLTKDEGDKLKKLVDEQTVDLSKALDEKEILIKEIHHRVKNNLAVISGLLELQIWNMEDEGGKRSLLESQLRIKTMATIHEKLYQNKSLAKVDIRDYVEDLVNIVSLSLKREDLEVGLTFDIEDVELSVNQAVPTALILNELICNAYEHAFVGKEHGELKIRFYQEGEMLFLLFNDNGVGIPDELLEKPRGTLGLTLIHTLTQQLKGIIEFENNEGTTVNISYPTELDEVTFLKEEAEA